MKRHFIGGIAAAAVLSGPTFAQTATMDPAVIEEQAASSSASLLVPVMLALVVLAIASQTPAAPVVQVLKK